MTLQKAATDYVITPLRRWILWQTVTPHQTPERSDRDACPLCGASLARVETPVPRYEWEPEDKDTSPVLDLLRCSGCGRYQTGAIREDG